jgi:transketolase N-terminal domain/subunit
MKTLTKDEKEALGLVQQDVEITIDNVFSSFGEKALKNLKSLSGIFVALYFKIINHDPKTPNWKNKDDVFSTNNYANIVESVVKVHAGYEEFSNLKSYITKHTFLKVENTFGEAIGYYTAARDSGDRHERFYYLVVSELDLLNNFSALEFIQKNNMRRIIIISYTKSSNTEINKENKLNGKLINLGFDTLVVNGLSPASVCEAVYYAKDLKKPTIILANVN